MVDTVLILVDAQIDFCPGGALPVPNGDEVVPLLNKAVAHAKEHGWLIVASRCWHPEVVPGPEVPEHFKKWPVHCVEGTEGAAFHPDLNVSGAIIISKGIGADEDAYSAFDGHTPEGVSLLFLLSKHGIRKVYIGGLATDYCVKATALDAVKYFETYVLIDACRAVNVREEDDTKAIQDMQRCGVLFLDTKVIPESPLDV